MCLETKLENIVSFDSSGFSYRDIFSFLFQIAVVVFLIPFWLRVVQSSGYELNEMYIMLCMFCFTYLFSNVGIYCTASETIQVISGWSCQYGYLISGILDILHNI